VEPAPARPGPKPHKLEAAKKFLREILKDGLEHPGDPMIAESSGYGVFGSTPEMMAAVPAYQHYFVERPEISGARFSQDLVTLARILPIKDVWSHEELARPDAHRMECYNVAFRPLGWHHLLQLVFQEEGRFMGYCPLWRSPEQKPFTREDAGFLRAAAPHVTHGLRAAQLLEHKARARAANTETIANSVSALAVQNQ
jgi:hypothetical protein